LIEFRRCHAEKDIEGWIEAKRDGMAKGGVFLGVIEDGGQFS
jgi:hypothetical protein